MMEKDEVECHEVELGKLGAPGWAHIKEKPKYCERESNDDECTCCPQCCTCGG